VSTSVLSRKDPSQITKRQLLGLSDNHCYNPACPNLMVVLDALTQEPTIVGKVAHIRGASPNGPRYDPSLSRDDAAEFPNLLMLCEEHHKIADDRFSVYTVKLLTEWKRIRELRAMDAGAKAISEVTDLDVFTIISWVATHGPDLVDGRANYDVLAVDRKMTKNGFTTRIRNTINVGLASHHIVSHFVQSGGPMFGDVVERAAGAIKEEYIHLRDRGFSSDLIWSSLVAFACGAFTASDKVNAGIAVLSYLFELCEVFEK
jgi:hypothetical protein